MRLVFTVLVGATVLLGCVSEKAPRRESATFDFKPTGAAPAKSTQKSLRSAPQPAIVAPAPDLRDSQTFTNRNAVITLINPLIGRVASINPALRFVVLDFSLNPLPAVGQQLSVYRRGQKVGEVKVTGPELNSNLVADLVAGEAQPGDEVRDR